MWGCLKGGHGSGAGGLQVAGPGMGPSQKSTGAEGPSQAPCASHLRLEVHTLSSTHVGTPAVSDAQGWLRGAELGAKSPSLRPGPARTRPAAPKQLSR